MVWCGHGERGMVTPLPLCCVPTGLLLGMGLSLVFSELACACMSCVSDAAELTVYSVVIR